MGVLADLVPKCQPAYYGAGAQLTATAGASWEWTFTGLNNNAGDPIDLTGVTITCLVLDHVGGATVADLTTSSAAPGSFTIALGPNGSAAVNPGSALLILPWLCSLDDGDDVVFIWGAGSSEVYVQPQGS